MFGVVLLPPFKCSNFMIRTNITSRFFSLQTNDKIYLLKRLNEEWLLGKDRRGCEGMFPANYIDVKVPLREAQARTSGGSSTITTTSSSISGSSRSETAINHRDISHSGTDSFRTHQHPQVRVLYTFNAETAEDLTIVVSCRRSSIERQVTYWTFPFSGKRVRLRAGPDHARVVVRRSARSARPVPGQLYRVRSSQSTSSADQR